MPAGVLVRGVVAAAHVPARHAEAEMHPGFPDPKAVFATVRAGHHFADFIEVRAGDDSHLFRYTRSVPTLAGPLQTAA
jgi:hypothetical protein